MSRPKETIERQVEEVMRRLPMELVIPHLVQERVWVSRGTRIYYLYVKRHIPLFFLGPLRDTFREMFKKAGVDPRSSVKVGGKANARHAPREVLKLSKYRVNKNFIGGRGGLSVDYLTVRLKEKGYSLMFWTRAAKIFIFKGRALTVSPTEHIRYLLKRLSYPLYVARDAVVNQKVGDLVKLIKEINYNEARGWPMIL